MWLFFIRQILVTVILAVWSVSALFESFKTNIGTAIIWFVIILIILIILTYVWARLSYHFYRYELREDGFRKELGVVWKKYTTIPYERIQNVDIYRGLLARLLGLSDLHIQTAGMSSSRKKGISAEGVLPGLSVGDAEQIRDELVKRSRQFKSQGL